MKDISYEDIFYIDDDNTGFIMTGHCSNEEEWGKKCWFCGEEKGKDLVFDIEFDTYVHLHCIAEALKENHEEAKLMEYLLERWGYNEN